MYTERVIHPPTNFTGPPRSRRGHNRASNFNKSSLNLIRGKINLVISSRLKPGLGPNLLQFNLGEVFRLGRVVDQNQGKSNFKRGIPMTLVS